MKIIICNSKNWFNLDSNESIPLEVKTISKKDELTQELIDNFKPNFIFFVHWSWRVERKIYSQNECIVFHTAPLPYGRGGSPIQNLILNGFKESPVCALRMTDELDAGPIYLKQIISLRNPQRYIYSLKYCYK